MRFKSALLHWDAAEQIEVERNASIIALLSDYCSIDCIANRIVTFCSLVEFVTGNAGGGEPLFKPSVHGIVKVHFLLDSIPLCFIPVC